MQSLTATPTPSEQLGELIALANQARMAWDLYLNQGHDADRDRLRPTVHNIRTARDRAEYQLYETMRKQSLAQVVTQGYKARIERFEGAPFVAIYRITDTGEERWTE